MSYIGRSSKLVRKAQEKISFLATAGQTVKTGLSYTPTSVEVTVNGILLTDVTDYTASNGNSVTFLVALALNDEVTLVSHKTFTVADTYSKADANTLLAAKATTTALATTNTAVALKSPIASPTFTGTISLGAGTISPVDNNSIVVGSGATNLRMIGTTGDIRPANANGSNSDNDIDLGDASARFKDLYLSGGVKLGGTAAANTLDDYEEGTWTPAIVGGSLTIAQIEAAHYTKIGSVVVAQTYLTLNNNGNSTSLVINGLPFINGGTSVNANQYSTGVCNHQTGADTAEMKYCRTQSNSSNIVFYKKASTHIPQSAVAGGYFIFSVTYRTTA